MSKVLFRVLGLPLAVLALGAMLTTSSAVAAGDGGGGEPPPSSRYADLVLGDFRIDDKTIVFTGTLTCEEVPTVAHIAMSAAQADKQGRVVYGAGGLDVKCEPGSVYPVELAIVPEEGEKFRPGMVNIGIALWADVPGCPEDHICWEQVGFVDWLAEKSKGA